MLFISIGPQFFGQVRTVKAVKQIARVKVLLSMPNAIYSNLSRIAPANSAERQVLVHHLVHIDDGPGMTHVFCDQDEAQKLIAWVRKVSPHAASQIKLDGETEEPDS